jgi:hypothetical protein
MFDPKAHLIQLPRRVKDPQTGHWTTRLEDYLEVKWRLVCFREKYPHGTLTTEAVLLDWPQGIAIIKATVADGEGGQATGTGTETRQGFEDFVEKAETRAIGRALALLGFGTQFVGEELSEGDHVADAPVSVPTAPPANGRDPAEPGTDQVPTGTTNGHTPRPTVVPSDAGLPCAGQAISALKPASLAMLINKVARLLQDEGERWVLLLHALETERNARLAKGTRPTVALVPPEGDADVP